MRNFSIIISFFVYLILFVSCSENEQKTNKEPIPQEEMEIVIPSCILDMIETIKDEEVRNPPAQIWKWDVDGNVYYYFTSDCCDQYNYLYNNECTLICAPDGGLSGGGDNQCPEFIEEIIKTLIWEDN